MRIAIASVHGALLLSACGLDAEDTSEAWSEVSVGTYQTQGCSTSVVLGLSKQIAEEVGCMSPTSLVKFEPSAKLQITSNAVMPYLHAGAKTDLEKVASTRTVQVNSAFRTVAQQYLLYRWSQLGRCGISVAATPGRSNHESGRALDLANYAGLIGPMADRGWAHDVPGDPVHFDHLGSPDIRGKDVQAFQRLWNRNNPGDAIAEDGAYGPQTEARLRTSSASGFAIGATCKPRGDGVEVVMIDGPDRIAPGAKATFAITVENASAAEWPETTQLVVAGGGPSELFDADSWTSASAVGSIGLAIPKGERGVLEVTVRGPQVTEEQGFMTQLALVNGKDTLGTLNLAVRVTPNGDDGTSGEGDEREDSGGCSAGGGSVAWGMLIPAFVAWLRRRRPASE